MGSFPNEVSILGHKYELISNDSKQCKTELGIKSKAPLKGCILTNEKQQIFINPTLHFDEWSKTLLHEVLHGIIHHLGIVAEEKPELEESFVEALSVGLFSVIKENFGDYGRTRVKKYKQRSTRHGKRKPLASPASRNTKTKSSREIK